MRLMSSKSLKIFVYFITVATVFTLGIISMLIPFLPFGWILIFCGMLLLLPYFPSVRKWLKKLSEKDNTGTFKKVRRHVLRFYMWSHEISKQELKDQL